MVEATRLLDLTAADIMSREVITIPRPLSLRAAAHRLASSGVSGAPVVDEVGRCVGVLSVTDLVRWLDHGPNVPPCRSACACFCTDWQNVDLEDLPSDEVSRYMTPNPITAPAETSLGALARTMQSAHVHRVIIVNGSGRPVGIVSSLDVLAAVAAEDEREQPAPQAW